MIGILVELGISWLLLWLDDKQNLEALGLLPSLQRAKEFLSGFIYALLFVALVQSGQSWLVQNPYRINPDYTFSDFASASAYVIKSVLFEELIFRGALLYILIKRTGYRTGISISTVAFGIYHWFSFGVWGQPVPMVYVVIITSLAGFIFAWSFYKTGSLYLPLALHLGYNFAFMILFSGNMPIGSQWLMKTHETDPATVNDFVNLLMTIFHFAGFPFFAWLFINRFVKHKLQPSLK
jgi:uncharacterized protein